MQKYVISISRQFGSLGRPIAKKLAEFLEIEYYDRDIVEEASKVHNIPLKEASNLEESAKYLFMSFPLGSGTTATQDALFKTESEMIKKLAVKESCIIVGRCADAILEDCDHLIRIFIYAPYEDRIVNCEGSVILYRRMKECGKDVKLYLIEGADHGGNEFWTKQVVDIMDDFIQRVIQ